ncbi:MAG: VanW family protein [Firmicutes bacterium]|nr:VanW family protein [Bacillota bacterium]
MRKVILIFAVLFAFCLPVYAGQVQGRSVVFYVGVPQYGVLENGRYVDTDVAPFVYDDRVYVPVRPLLNAVGVPDESISFDGKAVTAEVTIRGAKEKLVISLDRLVMTLGGRQWETYGSPVTRNDRVFLPIRGLAEALGYGVAWLPSEDDAPDMVLIYTLIQGQSSRSGIDRSAIYEKISRAREHARQFVTLADRGLEYPNGEKYLGSMYNARLAAEKIDGTVLQPGEVFSFNAATGPRTEENGFTWGLGFTGPDMGSGVCRTATILYQAAREAGLEIVERHTHIGGDVPYASHDDDAAVQWGVADLKFRNGYGFPVKIKIWSEGKNSLRAKIIKSLPGIHLTSVRR